MPYQRTTGLSATQSAMLITALNNYLTWIKLDQKPRGLTLPQALKITLISYRHHLTQETLAYLLEVSQPTISRTIATVEKILAKALEPLNTFLGERLKTPGYLVVDATLIPP